MPSAITATFAASPSTLYLVYNVSNSDGSRPGEFSAFRDLGTGSGAAGTQVLMVKFNYWLGL